MKYILNSISDQPLLITNIKLHTAKQLLNVIQFLLFYIYFNITVSIMWSHTTLLLCLYLKFFFCKMAGWWSARLEHVDFKIKRTENKLYFVFEGSYKWFVYPVTHWTQLDVIYKIGCQYSR
jgi:hypothetical protein